MTDTPPPPKKPAPKSPTGSPPQGKKPGANGAKPAAKKGAAKKGGFQLPPALAKLPMPALAGIAVAAFLLLYVVGTTLMSPSQNVVVQQETAAPLPPPTAQIPAQDTSAPQESGPAVQVDSNPEPRPGTAPSIPGYVGPTEAGVVVNETAKEYPIISRVGDEVKPLTREVMMSKEDFYAKTDPYEFDDVQGNKFLAFRVRLPKGWTQVTTADLGQLQLSNRLLGVLVYFTSPPDLDLRSSFRIRAQKLGHMINARDWLYQYALGNHLTLQALTAIDANRAEALYVNTELDVTYVIRMAVVINGPNVIIAEHVMPADKYETDRDLQIWTITSFYLKYKDMSPPEATKRLNFFDIAALDYPNSWELQRSNIKSIDNMDASIVNIQIEKKDVKTRLMGRIDVFLFANNDEYSLEHSIENINKSVASDNLVLGEQVGRFDPIVNDHNLGSVSYNVYQINNQEKTYQDYQYWVTVMKGKNYYFYVCMLIPPRAYDFYNWARNLSSYEYVIKTLHEGA